ncbi:30S ribosomal protein S14 [Halomicrobium katesii]|uniref:30S ribosomal protein S14 n=1 Tax=Halomicrobium katesii TaxID=437163 RepID=UPI000379FC2C|nr:30S ribosomal protein S14 [Halomicrobium katesii]
MTRETPQKDSGTEGSNEASDDDRHVCRMTGREQGLVGKYDIWLCRQSFRELAPKMGFEKYD